MKKILLIIGLVILSLIIIYEIFINTIYSYIFYSSLTEIPIPIFTKMEEKDTHGGFLGDGASLCKVYFSDEQAKDVLEKIKQNEHWNKSLLPEEVKQYINNSVDSELNIPTINNGYWLFINRYNQFTNKYDYTELDGKPSFNYTIALFDINTNILYIYSLDT